MPSLASPDRLALARCHTIWRSRLTVLGFPLLAWKTGLSSFAVPHGQIASNMIGSFDNSYARLPERFFARQGPTPVPSPSLLKVNLDLAGELGFREEDVTSDEAVAVFGGNRVPEGAEPLALAYAG